MDPERPIEKVLRQAAQSRRAQAGAAPELHAANRRMLQNEVARKYAAAGRGATGATSFFDLFMPRLGWSAAVIVGLGVAASLMLPRKDSSPKEMFLAKNDRVGAPSVMNETLNDSAARSASSATAKPMEPALAKSAQEVQSARREDLALAERDKDAMKVERRQTDSERSQLALNQPAPASQPVPAAAAPMEEKQKKELGREVPAYNSTQTTVRQEEMLQRRYGLAGAAPTATAAPSVTGGVAAPSTMQATDERARAGLAYSTAPAGSGSVSSSSLKLKAADSLDVAKRSAAPIARPSQRFVETQPAAKPILVSFELQQLGREVRIVDSDGSVYSGSFEPAPNFYYLNAGTQEAGATRNLESAKPQTEKKGALDDSRLEVDISYGFRVTGTNRSLNQAVTFTGQVVASTNALSVVGPAGTLNGNRFAPPELNPLPLQNSRISGKVVIGTNKEVEVNAIPVH